MSKRQDDVDAANQNAHRAIALLERDRLNMAAPEMLALLRVFDNWILDDDTYVSCPRCRKSGKHADDCKLAALLARLSPGAQG